MTTLHCPNCEHEVRSGEERCGHCGSDLGLTVPSVPSVSPDHPTVRPLPRLDFAPGQTFAERYTVIERVAEGGMGVVYKAIDNAVGAEVALKLIQPVLSGNPAVAERFRREVRVTRRLTHPNICRVFDIGSHGGVLYLSMAWVEGQTLQQLLRQAGTLSDRKALQIAGEIARALEAAHDAGVVHRDLKPANVMIDDGGRVVVLDFGLAREEGGERLAESRVQLGTLLYMAPEQRSSSHVDARADLYSLGLILREMLTGRRLEPGTAMPREFGGEVRPSIAPVLAGLLAERPDDRMPTAEAARAAIAGALARLDAPPEGRPRERDGSSRRRRLAVAAAAVVLAAAVGVAWWTLRGPVATDGDLPREADVYYRRGLHYLREESETVRSLDDAITFFNRALEISPDSPLLLASLGEAKWMRFARVKDDASRTEAREAVARAERGDPDLPEVRYAEAVGYMVESDWARAGRELHDVLDRRPRFAMAWARLGETRSRTGDYAGALQAFDRAVALEPGNFRVLIYRGLFHEHYAEYDTAADWYRKATVVKPDSRIAWSNLGAMLLQTGRYEEAARVLKRAIELEDRAVPESNLGTAHYMLGRYEEAVRDYLRATELEPDNGTHWANLADTYVVLNRVAEARVAYARAAKLTRTQAKLNPDNLDLLANEALYCAKAGDATCARTAIERVLGSGSDAAAHVLIGAVVYTLLGRDDTGLDLLERAVKLGASRAQIDAYPEFSRFASNPRYREIVSRAS